MTHGCGNDCSECSTFACLHRIKRVAPCPNITLLGLHEAGYIGFDKQIVELRELGLPELAYQMEELLRVEEPEETKEAKQEYGVKDSELISVLTNDEREKLERRVLAKNLKR